MAFHSVLALRHGIDPADVEAIRSGIAPGESRMAALSQLTRSLIEGRGHLDPSVADAVLAAGFTSEHVLEAIAVCAASTLTNYTANVTEPPLEWEFGDFAWRAA